MNNFCRICFQKNNLISKFCKCKGSIGFIHEICLRKTIEINGNKCGVCNNYFDNKYHKKNENKSKIDSYVFTHKIITMMILINIFYFFTIILASREPIKIFSNFKNIVFNFKIKSILTNFITSLIVSYNHIKFQNYFINMNNINVIYELGKGFINVNFLLSMLIKYNYETIIPLVLFNYGSNYYNYMYIILYELSNLFNVLMCVFHEYALFDSEFNPGYITSSINLIVDLYNKVSGFNEYLPNLFNLIFNFNYNYFLF
jgi:hypothetical protein